MPGQWGLTPTDLAAARVDCGNTAASISGQLASLGQYVDELGAEWMGNAKETFLVLMADYHLHATNIENTLDSISANLGANHDTVVETEQVNVNMLAPARF